MKASIIEEIESCKTQESSTVFTDGLQPISSQERIQLLDVLRGIAIFGIFVININAFSVYHSFSPEQQAALPTAAADNVVIFLAHLLFEGKFYSLFSLLFGIGFAVQMLRAEERGRAFVPLFSRRLAVLLAFGFIHLLLWSGDILALYAMVGFLLIPFRKLRDRTLLIWAAALLVSPILFYSAAMLSNGTLDLSRPVKAIGEHLDLAFGFGENVKDINILPKAGWMELLKYNFSGIFYRYSDLLYQSRIPKVLGMFLIGFCVGRRKLFSDLSAYRPLLRRVMFWGLALGLIGNIALAVLMEYKVYEPPTALGIWQTVAYTVGVAPLSLFYAIGITLLWQRAVWQSRLQVFAPVGRMALTNYLLQTVIGITLFYGVGFGLAGRIGPTLYVALAVVIFLAQVALSTLWLRYFRYGPVEWIWRWLTYGKRPPMLLPQHQIAGVI